MRQGLEWRLVFDAEVALGLRIFFEDFFEFAERFAGFDHDAQDLERANDAVARGGVVAEDHMSALLAADIVSIAQHGFDHIAVADLGAEDFSTVGFEGFIEAEVAHDGGNQGAALEAAALEVIHRRDGHDLIAIDQLAVFVAEQDAVGIAIVGDTDVRLALAGELLDLLGMGAAAVGVDVCPVRMVVDHDQIGTEFAQDAGAGFVGRAVRAIERDAERLEREVAWKALLGEFDIAAEGVVDAEGFADFCGGRADVFDLSAEDEMLDARFDFIVELEAVVTEEFDAVVLVGIVGGGKHDAGIGPQRAGDVGHAGRREGTDEKCVGAERGEAGDDCVFQHVA